MPSKTLILPNKSKKDQEHVEINGSLVIVGANGAGKTRLGFWLANKHQGHRISAQRLLQMESQLKETQDVSSAQSYLYGNSSSRWAGGNSASTFTNDFHLLMTYLSANRNMIALKYWEDSKRDGGVNKGEAPLALIDKVISLWNDFFPDKQITIQNNLLRVIPTNSASHQPYSCEELSDGQKGIFYLIAQCLGAPNDSVFIVDEPDIHLHKAILNNFWDRIEKEQSGCTFIYLTHDLDFAASRVSATKVCITGYDGKEWSWFEVPENEFIPEAIYLQILGSRKPILFAEGNDKTSLDKKILSIFYPSFTVIPVESFKKVIHSTCTFNNLNNLHHLHAYGIIDRVRRTQEDLDRLAKEHIYVAKAAEIENVLLAEKLLHLVAVKLGFSAKEADAIVCQIKEYVLNKLNNEIEKQVSAKVCHIIEERFRKDFGPGGNSQEEIQVAFDRAYASIDISKLYKSIKSSVMTIIQEKNYQEVLKIFNHKGLIGEIGKFFKLAPNGYRSYIKRLAISSPKLFRESIKELMPELPHQERELAKELANDA